MGRTRPNPRRGRAGCLRIRLDQPRVIVGFAGLMIGASTVLNVTTALMAVIAAQVVLALLIAIAGIKVDAMLQDAVPSAIRAGVAPGVSTFS